jgi:uncharacterized membrane protein
MQEFSLVKIGIGVIFLGMMLIAIGSFFDKNLFYRESSERSGKSETKFSFFGLFGIVPVAISNDKRLFVITVLMGIIFTLSMILMLYVNNTS